MAKRKVRKTKVRKAPKRRKKAVKSKSLSSNSKAHWKAFKQLEQRAQKAWTKLRSDIKRKAHPEILLRDQNQLLLLLGECNYMAKECMRCSSRRR